MLPKLDHGNFLPWADKNDDKLNDVQTDFVPRDYQIEMLNRAKKENTIVMMPTGTGKTYVAVLLIKHFIHQTLTDPFKEWKGHCKENLNCGNNECNCGDRQWKRTFFLVNNKPLVKQQKSVLEKHTGVSVGGYSGDNTGIDTWDKDSWFYQFKLHQILIMTTELFRNLLSTGILNTCHVNVLVLDECHHAKENHPMASVMREYWRASPQKPDGRVLGLTASVIDKKKISGKAELRISIENLQKMLSSRLTTPSEFVNQVRNVNLPNPEIHEYSPGSYAEQLLEIVDNLLETVNKFSVKSLPELEQSTYTHMKRIVTAVPNIITEVGIDGLIAQLTDEKGFIVEINNYLASPSIAPNKNPDGYSIECQTYEIGVTLLKQLKFLQQTADSLLENGQEVRMSVKFYELLKYILKLQSEQESETPRIIIFIERRRVVKAMYKYMCKLRKEVGVCANMKVSYVLGGTSSGGRDEVDNDHLTLSSFETAELMRIQKQQEQALIDFREGKSNILLATSVVEEGLDIPACNVVIRYDFPQTYRAFVQSRGRARKSPAKFTFFLKDTDVDEKNELLKSYHDVEMLLREFASDLTTELGTEADDVDEEMLNSLIPPLEVSGTGAKVTATSAIQRLNFYCSQLPKDEYTEIMPLDQTDEQGQMFKTTITLPKLCPIKETIIGDLMSNKKLAKMSAAMKALKRLYEENELTDALLPQFRQKERDSLLIAPEDGRFLTVDQKLKVPSTFWRKDLKEEKGEFYLYSIRLNLAPVDDDFAEFFVTGKDHKVACFGILSKVELPDFPIFTVFPRFGPVTVYVKFERMIRLPVHVLKSYGWFQEAIFTHALGLPYVRKSDAIFKTYFIIPLCWKSTRMKFTKSATKEKSAHLDIDSRFIDQLKKQWDFENNHWIFGNMPSDLDKCLDSVIFPAYLHAEHSNNNDITRDLYAVVKISELTAKSTIKGKTSEPISFEEYHKREHDIQLQDPDKNLLVCRYVTRHYAFLIPGASKKSNRQQTHRIAEIHKVHPIPSSLWSQATCLPSILWRIETFCLSRELADTVYSSYSNSITLLASHYDSYFSEKTVDLMSGLRRDLEYHGDIDWFETLHALTHKSCHEKYSLERLEFLGDRFLKFVSTLFYFRSMPDKHEGWLSKYRSQMISNGNLAIRSCKELRLPRFILNKKIDPKNHWIPPGFLTSYTLDKIEEAKKIVLEVSEEHVNFLTSQTGDKLSKTDLEELRRRKDANSCLEVERYLSTINDNSFDDDTIFKLCDLIPDGHLQDLGVKDIADSMEALLGLCVAKYGYRKGVDLLDKIKITMFQAKNGTEPEMLNNYLYEETPRPQVISSPLYKAEQKARDRCESLLNIEDTIGYKFNEPLYLLEALTHASFEDVEACYQRLEFLGDAVLDVLMVFHIYEDKPHYDQGQMSDLLSSLVCNTTLSKICTKLQLYKSLLYDSPELYNVLARFLSSFEADQLKDWYKDLSLDRVFVHTIETDTLDERPVLNLDNKVVQAPKILGDLVESIIGAIYLDSGEDIFKVRDVIWGWFEPFYESFSTDPPKNPKAIINELYPGLKKTIMSYPGDHYRFVATVTIATRDDNKVTSYEFKTVGREKETAFEVSCGRALHFHRKYLANDISN